MSSPIKWNDCFIAGVSGRSSELTHDKPFKRLKTATQTIAAITNQVSTLTLADPTDQKPKKNSRAVVDEISYFRGAARLKLKKLYNQCKKMIKEAPSARDWLTLIDQMEEKVKKMEKRKEDKDS